MTALTGLQTPTTLNLPVDRCGSAGPEAVALAATAGLMLDPWQQFCLLEGMRENSQGRWAAFEVCLVVPRQNGKGSILEARQLAGLFLLGEQLAVHTAHEFKTATEHMLRIVALIQSNPDLDRGVRQIRRGAGEQAIELKSGARLRFLARSGGSGRGLSGDTVYLDEGFDLTANMMGALLPTMSARPNPQMWVASSAPKSSSEVLLHMRRRGAEGKSPRMFFAEWGNPEGVDIADREAWARANPSLGVRAIGGITEEFIEAELEAFRSMPDEFARERLGVPDRDPAEMSLLTMTDAAWQGTWTCCPRDCPDNHLHKAARTPIKPGEISLAFDVDRDGKHAAISIAAGSADAPYVETVDMRPGTGWVAPRLLELTQRWQPIAIGCNGSGPAGWVVGSLHAQLSAAGIDTNLVHQLGAVEYKQACGSFYRDVAEGVLSRAGGQGPLSMAVVNASTRPLGDGFAWDVRGAVTPISPLVSATIAKALLPTAVVAPVAKPVFAA